MNILCIFIPLFTFYCKIIWNEDTALWWGAVSSIILFIDLDPVTCLQVVCQLNIFQKILWRSVYESLHWWITTCFRCHSSNHRDCVVKLWYVWQINMCQWACNKALMWNALWKKRKLFNMYLMCAALGIMKVFIPWLWLI
jgi:hypothetical protein